MFRGEANTVKLRTAALGAANLTDTLRNVWWIWSAAHSAFESGKLTVIPQLEPTQIPFNPSLISEVPNSFTPPESNRSDI